MSMGKKFTFEYVYKYFKEQGCELLEEEYINSGTKMKYRCNCGNVRKITFASFKKGHRCKECGIVKSAKNKRFTINKVKKIFEDGGCELLGEEYIN